jgi:hypothetical protein
MKAAVGEEGGSAKGELVCVGVEVTGESRNEAGRNDSGDGSGNITNTHRAERSVCLLNDLPTKEFPLTGPSRT